MQSPCLAYDLGGTKVEIGVVDAAGQILAIRKELLDLELGCERVIEQLINWGRALIREYPAISAVGVSSCGPLDPHTGELHDPTNLLTNGKGWGTVALGAMLQKAFEVPVRVDNDAACAVLAERWKGAAQNYENALVVSLGTGLGVGIICNGTLVRAGRNLHPEAGHIIIAAGDKKYPCACGVSGDAEAFLSGKNFVLRFNTNRAAPLDGAQITARARAHDPEALAAFATFSEAMAITLHNYCVMFCPEVIIFAGSFAEAFDVFAPQTETRLRELLSRRQNLMPKLCASPLANHAGLLGAAYVATNS